MLIRYNTIDAAHRDIVRTLENKPHISYVRYLMLKRWAPLAINQELFKLGMSGSLEEHLWVYFRSVMRPMLQNAGLDRHYLEYRAGKVIDSLSFEFTFEKSQAERIRFCKLVKNMECELFFSSEILKYYGSPKNVPIDNDTGEPVLDLKVVPDFTVILTHPKRAFVEMMFAEGKSPKMIHQYLASQYDEILPIEQISFFGRAFFNIKRKDLERTIEDLNFEVKQLEDMLADIRNNRAQWLAVSDRAVTVSTIKTKIENLQNIIRRMSSFHHHAAYHAGVLEFSHIKEMFADVMIRTHRRYVETDRRTEDDAVGILNTLVGMMSKATDKLLSLDDRMAERGRKTVSEEMLEVVMPTVDRILEEERNAAITYYNEFGNSAPILIESKPVDHDILGFDD